MDSARFAVVISTALCIVAPWLSGCNREPQDTITGRDVRGQAADGIVYLRDLQDHTANVPGAFRGDCLACHASPFRNRLEPGLGNAWMDWSVHVQDSIQHPGFTSAVWALHAGPNPLFRMVEAACIQKEGSLIRRETPAYSITDSLPVPVSDIPPLWNVRKKTRLYYNGQGVGDFRKLLMTARLMTLGDTVEATHARMRFADVAAWIESLEPPQFDGPIDEEKASAGRELFERECRKCHGSYGMGGSYPNKIVPLERIETDPYYALYWDSLSHFPSWYNASWFGQGDQPARMEPQSGYIAPPLDGIWASAPYLHNGSIPNLLGVLDSRQRPALWDRRLDKPEFDSIRVGWMYESVEESRGASTYDTRRRGYSNQGHTFGDDLTEDERWMIIEYLKTL